MNFAECILSQDAGSIDAAFCKITNTSYTPSNTIDGTSNILSTLISEPGVGTVVNMRGAISGSKTGKILSTNASTSSNGVINTDLTEVALIGQGGDSGGLFYSYISETNARHTLGVVLGGTNSTTFYSKANKINSIFGTDRY